MNARLLPAWLLVGLCTFAGTSCHNNDPEPEQLFPEVYQVSYAQTQCADKWGQANTPQKLESVATAYLAQQGITLLTPNAAQTGIVATCAACTCLTGVVLKGSVSVRDLAAIEALGFKKI